MRNKASLGAVLLIFAKAPIKGQVKTRLAASIGAGKALELYRYLLEHTAAQTRDLPVEKVVYYSPEIVREDVWDNDRFGKRRQLGEDLGQRMEQAFRDAFSGGYQKVVLIGTDLYDMASEDITRAFEFLESHDVVIGPAHDGGYYLLGMKSLHSAVFSGKTWSTDRVLKETLQDLQGLTVKLLEVRRDIDEYMDIPDLPEFEKFKIKND